MKRLLVALFLCIAQAAAAQVYSGVSVGAALGGSAEIAVQIDYRSFGQTGTATEGSPGTLNIKYGTPIMVWGTATTVNGVAVNRTGWGPKVWFDWNWDDNSLGSVVRGGRTVDLGKSVGLVASHAFLPSSFAETCNSGTNSAHAVTLTVYAVVSGVLKSDSATLNVCVEDPDVTWAGTSTICYHDGTLGSGCPAGATDGGNITSSLQTAIRKCDVDGASRRVLLKGGVRFSTGSDNLIVGAQSCFLGTYGTGKAEMKFTATGANAAIAAEHANCAGYRMHNFNLYGSGDGPRIIAGETNTGCYALIDVDAPDSPGEEFRGLTISDPGAGTQQSEGYYFLVDYANNTTAAGTAQLYAYANYLAFVGGSLTKAKPEHNLRLAQWTYIVVDASLFEDHTLGYNMLRFAQDCGASDPCPNSPEAHTLALTRNVIRGNEAATTPVQICNAGSGGTEATKCRDMDLLQNLSYQGGLMSASIDWFYRFEPGTTGHIRERVRAMQNLCDMTGYDSTSDVASCFAAGGTVDSIAFFGNVAWRGDTGGATAANCTIFNGNVTTFDSGNNVSAEDVGGACTPFTGETEAATDLTLTTEPFDGGTPVDYAPEWSQFKITSANTSLKGQGEIAAYPTDATDGESIPQSSDYDAGVDDE